MFGMPRSATRVLLPALLCALFLAPAGLAEDTVEIPEVKPAWSLEFETEVWDELTIKTYQTGQRAEQARTWIQEINAPARVQVKNGRSTLTYVTQTAQARYIRIETAADRKVKLLSIRIHPVKRSG